jgi:hypothetical protein
MNKKFRLIITLLFLLLMGCNATTDENNNIPNQLHFEGKSDHWVAKLEIKQSINENLSGKYNYRESIIINYIGADLKEMEVSDEKYPITWKIAGSENIDSQGSSSHFQKQIGNPPGGKYTATNAADFYIKEDVKLKVVIKWGERTEVLPLKFTARKGEE